MLSETPIRRAGVTRSGRGWMTKDMGFFGLAFLALAFHYVGIYLLR